MVGNPVESLTLRDVLTRLVPGGVVVAAGWYAAWVAEWQLDPDRTAVLLAVLLASYLVGELLEFVRSRVFPAPWPFVVRVRETFPSDDENPTVGGLRGVGESAIERSPHGESKTEPRSADESNSNDESTDESSGPDAVEQLCQRYHEAYAADDPVDVYDYLLLEYGDAFSRRTVRLQSLYRFWNSTRLAAMVAAPILATTVGGLLRLALLAFAVLVVLSMVAGNVALDWLGETYTALLFKEYRLASGDDVDHNENRAKSDPSS